MNIIWWHILILLVHTNPCSCYIHHSYSSVYKNHLSSIRDLSSMLYTFIVLNAQLLFNFLVLLLFVILYINVIYYYYLVYTCLLLYLYNNIHIYLWQICHPSMLIYCNVIYGFPQSFVLPTSFIWFHMMIWSVPSWSLIHMVFFYIIHLYVFLP